MARTVLQFVLEACFWLLFILLCWFTIGATCCQYFKQGRLLCFLRKLNSRATGFQTQHLLLRSSARNPMHEWGKGEVAVFRFGMTSRDRRINSIYSFNMGTELHQNLSKTYPFFPHYKVKRATDTVLLNIFPLWGCPEALCRIWCVYLALRQPLQSLMLRLWAQKLLSTRCK